MPDPIIECQDVSVHFGKKGVGVAAVSEVTLDVRENEIFGVVGESGSGKSTLARAILGLQTPVSGAISLEGRGLDPLPPKMARQDRAKIQYVHQDSGAALDPWWSVGSSLEEGLIVHGVRSADERHRRIERVLDAVGLNESFLDRYPHELSGGQQRRIGLARILVLEPQVVILDEPTSGLDVSVQAAVLNLILELRAKLNLTFIFISHDLAVVHKLCDRLAVMHLGHVVELGESDEVFSSPAHPYTKSLLDSVPRLDGPPREVRLRLKGEPPKASIGAVGCSYCYRCPKVRQDCSAATPVLADIGDGRRVACFAVHAPAGDGMNRG
ncbi:MAG: ABC transporter ATP-binding protein [Hyphomicrobiaceae bacterium]|nr:ABC transporter ATP-binding protein [Hyphomicrobiaceae bacterium]